MTAEPPFTLVLVRWLDSTNVEGGSWMRLDELDGELDLESLRHESVGYLLAENDNGLLLGGDRSDDQDPHATRVAGVRAIPRVALLEPPTELQPRLDQPRRGKATT